MAVVQLIFTCSYNKVKRLHLTLSSYNLTKKVKEKVSAPAYRIIHRTMQLTPHSNCLLAGSRCLTSLDPGFTACKQGKDLPRRQRYLREELLKEHAFGLPAVYGWTWNNWNSIFELGWAWISGWGRAGLLPCASSFCLWITPLIFSFCFLHLMSEESVRLH